MLRDHGQKDRYCHEVEGYNGRCDALQAAALRVKLKYLPAWNEARRKNASLYISKLERVDSIGLPRVAEGCLAVFHQFVVQIDNRDEVAAALRAEGISTGCHYPIPLHLQQAYAHMELSPGSFPVAERCAERFLSLPMFPELTTEQIVYVSERLQVAVEKVAGKQ
jgi:dTDP-4-amino-4,6-dideoxygalactose transaminase